MKTLLVGMGNPILSDDRVGLEVARRVIRILGNNKLEYKELSVGGLDFLAEIADFDDLIIIDAISTGKFPPGYLHKFGIDNLNGTAHLCNPHDINLATSVKIAPRLGYKVPLKISIFAIEVKECLTFSENMSKEIKDAVPKIVENIVVEVKKCIINS